MEVPAWFFLLVWIGIQIISQVLAARTHGLETSGVAYAAHIGGFVAGMGLIVFFEKIAELSRGTEVDTDLSRVSGLMRRAEKDRIASSPRSGAGCRIAKDRGTVDDFMCIRLATPGCILGRI